MIGFFSPTINVNGRGDPELEGAIVRDVATYGSQIGQLTALVLAMAGDNRRRRTHWPNSKQISERSNSSRPRTGEMLWRRRATR